MPCVMNGFGILKGAGCRSLKTGTNQSCQHRRNERFNNLEWLAHSIPVSIRKNGFRLSLFGSGALLALP